MICKIVKNNTVGWSRRRRVMRTLEGFASLADRVASDYERCHFTEQEAKKLTKVAGMLNSIVEHSKLSEELLTPEISFQFTLED